MLNWDLLVIGLTIALEPLSLVAFILLLATDRGIAKGAAFLVGWVACLTAIIAGTVLITGGKPPKPKTVPSQGVSIVTIILGVVLLGVAVRAEQRRRSGIQKVKKEPKWMAKLDGMSLVAAATFGVLLQPWGLVAAGAASAIDTDVSSTPAVVSLVLFGVLASSTLLVMEGWMALNPERATTRLADLRAWTDNHRNHVIVVLSTVVGLLLIAKGIHQLT